MNPLAIHPGTAHLLLQAMLIGWAAIETVVLVRIHVEEAELATALGPQYTRYASRTSRLIPGLW